MRYTDHGPQIERLREVAGDLFARLPDYGGDVIIDHLLNRSLIIGLVLDAAVDLLEAHDATGIVLDDWSGPRDLVEWALTYIEDQYGDDGQPQPANVVRIQRSGA